MLGIFSQCWLLLDLFDPADLSALTHAAVAGVRGLEGDRLLPSLRNAEGDDQEVNHAPDAQQGRPQPHPHREHRRAREGGAEEEGRETCRCV